MDNGQAQARQGAIVEEARGRRWAQPRREVGLTGANVKMDFAARTEKEISWRGQKRAALAVTGNHDRVHDPLFTKKATVNNIPILSFPRRQFGYSSPYQRTTVSELLFFSPLSPQRLGEEEN